MRYEIAATFSVLIFSLIHFFSPRMARASLSFQSKFLSTAGGVAIAYVFIDLLPKLCKSDTLVKASFPFFERHVFILAMAGFLLFYCVDRSKNSSYLSLISYSIFNFLIGYAIIDKNDPEVRPLVLFTIAMGLHYFVNDYTLHYNKGRWVLIGALFAGWLCGLLTQLPAVAIALVAAFIGGGVIMNTIRHELPKDNPNDDKAFLFSAFLYTLILLFIG